MKPFNLNKHIEDVDDFNQYASEVFIKFLEGFTKENGLIRDLTEGDHCCDESIEFVYTDRGNRLASRMKSKLWEIGEARFPQDSLDIEIDAGSYYIEY